MNSSNSSSSDAPPSLQSLRIQLPENYQPSENGICQPPLDPPSFDVPNVRRCIKTTVRIQNYDKPQEVLILTSISSSVDSILSSFDDSQKSNNNNNTDSFDDSDFSDFSETTSSEEEDTEDDEMEEDEDEGGTIQNGTHHSLIDGKTIPQSTTRDNAPKNQGYRMKAYWLRKEPLVENSHGVFKTHVYYAKVIEKADFNWVVTNEAVAIKAVSWRCITACRNRLSEDFIKEIAALAYISDWHSGRNFRETHVLKADTVMSNESHLYTVMPYCDGGDLCMRVAEKSRFSEDESRYWFKQILKGLETLQLMKICHRDLSPENMIILDNNALVIDFGMCLRVPYTPSGRHLIKPQTPCGKLPHMSPELFRKHPFDGHAVDIWAAGTILLFMLTGKRLQNPPLIDNAFDNVELDYVSRDAMDLLRKMFRLDPKNRLSLEQIKEHPFVQHEFLFQR